MARVATTPVTSNSTVANLADDWAWMDTHSGFRLCGGWVKWERAIWAGETVRISRLTQVKQDGHWKIRQINQYVLPSKQVQLIGKTT